MKIFLDSVGCRLNQSEIETMARQLLASGHEIVADPSEAEKIIINTCVVTQEAARDSRSRTRRYHRLNETADIIATGCYATITPGDLQHIEGVDIVVLNMDKDKIAWVVDPSIPIGQSIFDLEPIQREYLALQMGRTRAYVKVQDGCDNKCTFCITTIARGKSKSRRIGEILSEIQGLAASGCKEAVLTGVHLGSYGADLNSDFSLDSLVKSILDHTDIPRLRISSLEPWNIPEGFFDLWSNQRLLPHLHIPLQSGSDRILRRMARRTNRAKFRDLVQTARRAVPNINISTDLIAGFPGETEHDFEETYHYVAEIAFGRLHVFTFSGRPGTAANQMADQIPVPVRKERARKLIELGNRLSLDYHKRNNGSTRSVLWEQEDSAGRWVGYSENYIRVHAAYSGDLTNTITKTVISDPTASGMSGQVLPADRI
ncbi:MAG: tRNA (N(6)-L-threonylcarbamoyladenosine(37)-C(2))-methylthiotransferase MtaB [Candidatus Promineifilaceae bacterium]